MKLIPIALAFLCLGAQAQPTALYTVCISVHGDDASIGITAAFESALSHALRRFDDVTIRPSGDCWFEIDVALLKRGDLVAGSVIFKTPLHSELTLLAGHVQRTYSNDEYMETESIRSLTALQSILEGIRERDPAVVENHFVLLTHEASIEGQAARFAALFDSLVLEPKRRIAHEFD